MASSTGKTMAKVRSADGTQIAFDRTGDGPAVIFVDGANAYRAINPTGTRLAELLAPAFTVFTYDRRGRGDSGDNAARPSKDREIEDLAAMISAAGGSAYVFGGSSGAMLALDGAARDLGIERLALYEAPLRVDSSFAPVPEDYGRRLHELLSAGRRSDAVELFFSEVLRLPAGAVGQMKSSPFWPKLEEVAPTLEYEAALYGDALSGNPLGTDRWGSVLTPTLVIDGGGSPPMMRSAADALARILPNAERRTLKGQTHAVDPIVLGSVLLDFFQGVVNSHD